MAIDPYLNETTRPRTRPAAARAAAGPPALRPGAQRVCRPQRREVRPARAPPGAPDERHDWEILTELAGRLFAPLPLRAAAIRALAQLTPDRILDLLLRLGPHELPLARLRAAPHGLDLGPLQPGRVADRVATPDGLIDLAPEDFVREARIRLLDEAGRQTNGDLTLIGRRQTRSNNSWLHNSPPLMKGRARCTLLVHPDDAAPRRLATGDLAEVASEAGSVTVPVGGDRRRPARRRQPPPRLGSRPRGSAPTRRPQPRRRERQRRDQRAPPGHPQRQRRLQRACP